MEQIKKDRATLTFYLKGWKESRHYSSTLKGYLPFDYYLTKNEDFLTLLKEEHFSIYDYVLDTKLGAIVYDSL
jgi:hypothetical protein